MPQMAPMNWLTLMLLFSIILIITSILNYSIQQSTSQNTPLTKTEASKVWKW
uniref:ATP synthase complex subunit 8 n=1 Tax=Prosopocoilus confucius TaxID=618424 RepID=A0A342LJ58_9SCAR|nr:ATP synthase F0 subunit 8 [Prosopocoilus confucius]ANY60159.1 ATP synthase F0 subunit 8 [Prosopocoilus confucius]